MLPYLAALVSSQRGSGSRCGSFALWVAGKSLLIFPGDLEANRAESLQESLLCPGADPPSAETARKKSTPCSWHVLLTDVDVCRGQLPRGAKMDADELALKAFTGR